jgi:septal ring factor EnvC (AmiA/AmiB activator)
MKSLILTALLLPLSGIAQEDDSARLREALKNTTLQLRTAQGETATAQAASIAAEQKAKSLEAKIAELEKRNAALAKQSNDDKAASEKSIATLSNRLAEREKRLVDYIARSTSGRQPIRRPPPRGRRATVNARSSRVRWCP